MTLRNTWRARRALGLAALVGAAPVSASQTEPTVPVDASSGLRALEVIESDEAATTPDLADLLLRSLGRPWADVDTPDPDSSDVEGGTGNVFWSVPGFPVDGFRVFVQGGLVESATLDFAPGGPDLAAFAGRLYDRLGSPRADGFYATDQTGYPFSLAVDAAANRLTARAVPGQTVGDGPLPLQFSSVASRTDSVHTFVDVPPTVVGGLEALHDAAVYPAGAEDAEGIVYVQVVVETDGRASGLTIARSPDSRLDAAALDAIATVRFVPGRHRGQPVRVQTALPVRFAAPSPPIVETPPLLVDGLEGLQRRVVYPRAARRAGVEGAVMVWLTVEPDGRPSNVRVSAEGTRIVCRNVASTSCSEGRSALVKAALQAVEGSRFEPATREGEPVDVEYALPVRFVLR